MTQTRELIEQEIFAALNRKYVQRADARQHSMGLQYMEAETHDLSRFIANLFATRLEQAEALADALIYIAETSDDPQSSRDALAALATYRKGQSNAASVESGPQQEAVEQGRVLTFEQVVPSSPGEAIVDAVNQACVYLEADAEAWIKGSERHPHQVYLEECARLRREVSDQLRAALATLSPSPDVVDRERQT